MPLISTTPGNSSRSAGLGKVKGMNWMLVSLSLWARGAAWGEGKHFETTPLPEPLFTPLTSSPHPQSRLARTPHHPRQATFLLRSEAAERAGCGLAARFADAYVVEETEVDG